MLSFFFCSLFLDDFFLPRNQDQDPYVRKTAVIGVAKLFDINPSLAEMNGFLEDLAGMVADSNPMVPQLILFFLSFFSFFFSFQRPRKHHKQNDIQVVSNAVAALSEIMEESGNRFLQTPGVLQKLLTALNECNE